MTGDYYRRGDPGLFSSIGGLLGRAASGAVGFLGGGPIGAVTGITGGSMGFQLPGQKMKTFTPSAAAPGGVPLFGETGRKKRRRINPGNAKALKRADKRIDAFVTMSKGALKHTNYKIVSKSAGKSSPRVSISERGPGSVRVG